MAKHSKPPSPLLPFLYYPGAAALLKWNRWCRALWFESKWGKMWVKICNLNHIPKIGGRESRSCRRRNLSPNLALMSVCVSAASYAFRRVIIQSEGRLSCPRKGTLHALFILQLVLFFFWLANSCLLCLCQVKSPQLFFSFQLFLIFSNFQPHASSVALWTNLWTPCEKFGFNEIKWSKKTKQKQTEAEDRIIYTSLTGFISLLPDFYECKSESMLSLRWFAQM